MPSRWAPGAPKRYPYIGIVLVIAERIARCAFRAPSGHRFPVLGRGKVSGERGVSEVLAAGPGSGPRMRSPLPVSARVRWAWLQGLPLRRRRLRRILRMLEGRTPHSGTLVDVGGGTGEGTDAAVRTAPPGAYRTQIVLDPQSGMLLRGTRARNDRIRIGWVRGSGSRLPFPNGSVDVVLSLGVLCCMRPTDVPAAVAELGRVLRTDGYCVLGVPRGWADYCEPLFRGAGFRQVDALRPGRAVFQRATDTSNSGTGESATSSRGSA